MSDGHEHSHTRPEAGAEGGYYAHRIRAMEALLVDKGTLTKDEVRAQVSYMEYARPPTALASSPERGRTPSTRRCSSQTLKPPR